MTASYPEEEDLRRIRDEERRRAEEEGEETWDAEPWSGYVGVVCVRSCLWFWLLCIVVLRCWSVVAAALRTFALFLGRFLLFVENPRREEVKGRGGRRVDVGRRAMERVLPLFAVFMANLLLLCAVDAPALKCACAMLFCS